MSNKKFTILLILGILLFGLLFYYYSIRPSQIKKDCASWARKKVMERENQTMELYNNQYTICLREKGL
jgi:hypothetical protein